MSQDIHLCAAYHGTTLRVMLSTPRFQYSLMFKWQSLQLKDAFQMLEKEKSFCSWNGPWESMNSLLVGTWSLISSEVRVWVEREFLFGSCLAKQWRAWFVWFHLTLSHGQLQLQSVAELRVRQICKYCPTDTAHDSVFPAVCSRFDMLLSP